MLTKNHQEIVSEASEICNFYAGKTIFITGAAGFLGTVLLETFLRCCPDISRVYILLRPKKGMDVDERKNSIFKKDIFIKLKTTNPDVLEKVTAVSGDTSLHHLGLNENEYNKLTKEVSVVFHIAATISFTKPLGFIVNQNVVATSNILEFCRKLENLKAFVYTSSVYSNSNQKGIIEEKIYDLPFSSEEIIKHARDNNDHEMMRFYGMCNPPFPNFYTFSKCVAENFLKETAYDLPVCIIRPSIIVNCAKGSLPGYVEENSAIVNLLVGGGKGFIRVCEVDRGKGIELIPADVTANAHIVAAFNQASKRLVKLYKFYDKAMKAVNFFTMNDWDMKNKNFQALSKGLNAIEEEMFCMDLKEFTFEKEIWSVTTGSSIYLRNGKPYEEKFKWKCLRYFLTFLLVCFFLGSASSILYLIFKTMM